MRGITVLILCCHEIVAHIAPLASQARVRASPVAQGQFGGRSAMVPRFMAPPLRLAPARAVGAREVASKAEDGDNVAMNVLGRFIAQQKRTRSERAQAVKAIANSALEVPDGDNVLGRFIVQQKGARSERAKALKTIASSALDHLNGGIQNQNSGSQYPRSELVTQASPHLTSIPIVMLSSFMGSGLAFFVFCLHRGALTIQKEPLLA